MKKELNIMSILAFATILIVVSSQNGEHLAKQNRNLQVVSISQINSAAFTQVSVSTTTSSSISFSEWKVRNGKQYTNSDQQTYRMLVFNQNQQTVNDHNDKFSRGVESYTKSLNDFADLTSDQFAGIYLMAPVSLATVSSIFASASANAKAKPTPTPTTKTSTCTGAQVAIPASFPTTFTWTTAGAVTAVKNQGQCGSCWAFSATGVLQGANYIASSTLVSYSEQQLVDCSGSYSNYGCSGGLPFYALYYTHDNGITTSAAYPYVGRSQRCKTFTISFKNSNCIAVTPNSQSALMASIMNRPVSVCIGASSDFQLYSSGVFGGSCATGINHAVLATGFGSTTVNSVTYPTWQVKNSWGTNWGMKGYILMKRTGDGTGQCFIQQLPVAALA